MSSVLNAITAPVGLKLLPGGPYNGRDATYAAEDASKSLTQQGQGLLTQGTSALPGLYSQLASLFGVNNPFASSTPAAGSGTASAGGVADPYGMSATQTAQYNQTAAQINARRDAAIKSFRANAASRGLSSSSAKATEQYIHSLADNELNTAFASASTAAQQSKAQGLLQLLSGAQSNISQGGQLAEGGIQGTAQAGQQLAADSSQSMSNLIGALTLGLKAGGVLPTTSGGTTSTGTNATSGLATLLGGGDLTGGITPTSTAASTVSNPLASANNLGGDSWMSYLFGSNPEKTYK